MRVTCPGVLPNLLHVRVHHQDLRARPGGPPPLLPARPLEHLRLHHPRQRVRGPQIPHQPYIPRSKRRAPRTRVNLSCNQPKASKRSAIFPTHSDSTRSARHLITWRRWIALNNVTDQTSVFSVLRVLRPLRILRMFPELRRLTGAVSMAVPQLINLASLVSPSYSPKHSPTEIKPTISIPNSPLYSDSVQSVMSA